LNEYSIRFEFSYNDKLGFFDNPEYNNIRLREQCWIRFTPKNNKKIGFQELHDLYNLTKDFLSLSLRSAVYSLSTVGYMVEKEENKEVEIYIDLKDYKKISSIKNHSYSFNLNDVEDNFSQYLDNWFSKYHTYKSLYDNFFGVLYEPNLPAESVFLFLVSSIELFYNIEFRDERVKRNIATHSEKIEQTIDLITKQKDIPSKFKRYIKKQLKAYAEFISLENALNEILESFSTKIDHFHRLLSTEDIKIIVEIRNKIAHGNIIDIGKFAASMFHEHDLIHKLKRINEILLLKIIGIPDDKISQLVFRYY
jgi:hypothetical protein